MMFSIEERATRRGLRKAIRLGFPDWARLHVEERLRYAVHRRDEARKPGLDRSTREHCYTVALRVVSELRDLLARFLFSRKGRQDG